MDGRRMVKFRVENEIELREFTHDDAASVFAAVTENYEHLRPFMHWITPDYSLDSAKDFISRSIRGRDERESLGLGIFRGERLIGSIGFVQFDWKAMKTEIGYWIAAAEEGKGVVSGACRLLIDFAIRELGINRIEIRCSAENSRSSAIPVRFGFKKEGHLRQAEYRDGRLHDFEIFGLLAEEWEDPQSSKII